MQELILISLFTNLFNWVNKYYTSKIYFNCIYYNFGQYYFIARNNIHLIELIFIITSFHTQGNTNVIKEP